MLSWWQWLVLAAVPPAIIALYFLKLKRRPLEVPSTYLWHKSIEDLRVNSIWQRLRRNLLLFLQLLLIVLAMLALLRPTWRGERLIGDRFIFLVDNSASMRATDVEPSRLDDAKRRAGALIDQMGSGDVAMIVSFSDSARVEHMFTGNRRRLRRSLDEIVPSQRSTSLDEALKVASGLANPGRSAEDVTDTQVAEAMPATIYIFSDGKFEDVAGFSLGNLEPVYVPIGRQEAANVGIVAFSARRHETRADRLQAFARLENFGPREVTVPVELRLDGELAAAAEETIGAGEVRGVVLDVGAVDSGVLTLRLTIDDDLAVDNEAWVAVNPPRLAKVLLITPGNEPLEVGLSTSSAAELAELSVESPAFLKTKTYRADAEQGAYDLVIYDRCRPETMPRANTLFIGRLPPAGGWSAGEKVDVPEIIDTNPAHPLTQWLATGDVLLYEGAPLDVPPGGSVLIDSDAGPMFAVAPREGFEDAVLGFVFIEEVAGSGRHWRTNWPIRPSFPVFLLNVLNYLGGSQHILAAGGVRPGRPVVLESPTPEKGVSVRTPSGERIRLHQDRSGKFNFTGTEELGIYEARCGGKTIRRLAVNLFDPGESDLPPRPDIDIGWVEVKGQSGWEPTSRDIWRGLLLAGLVVLLLEWYIYNRRVYL
jgi:hypothetical protein